MVEAGLAPDAVASAYNDAAPLYDAWHWSALWQQNEVPIVAALLGRCGRGLLVDAGCGTGRYRTVARALGFPYLGVDVSPGMLAAGAERLGESTSGDALLQADLRSTGLGPGSAAVTLCARTLCHLPDLNAAFAEFARITTAGGALIITDLHPTFRVPSTRLPTANGKRELPTFRRSPEELAAIGRLFGFGVVDRIDGGRSSSDAFFVVRMDRR